MFADVVLCFGFCVGDVECGDIECGGVEIYLLVAIVIVLAGGPVNICWGFFKLFSLARI